jgi:hypothetical protein
VQNLAIAGVLAAFFSLAFRAFVLPFIDGERHPILTLARSLSGLAFLCLGLAYAFFTAHMLVWSARAALVAGAVALLVLAPVGLQHVMTARKRRTGGRPAPGVVALLVQLCLLLGLLLVATLTLMQAGFVALTADRVVLLVDVTGETGTQVVRWAPADQPLREERLVTHRVVFRQPDGSRVSEAWIFGDQVAVKGRVLRLSPILNAAGVPNLFELLFAHNGYETAERHNGYPHAAVELPPMGPLAVHPWWRPLQRRLIERWEKRTTAEAPWSVRSATTESTYFPLLDAQGQPLRQTYRLVITPGGLSAS